MAPWTGIYIFFIPIPIPAILYAVIYVGYSIWMDRRGTDNVNHSAHLWGAGYGVLFALVMQPALFPHFLSALANPASGSCAARRPSSEAPRGGEEWVRPVK